jgi:6-phosphogluconolactonase
MPCNRTIRGGCRGLRNHQSASIEPMSDRNWGPEMHAWIVLILAFALVAGCGGAGSDGTPAVPSRFLYASAYAGPNTFPASIYGFGVHTGGALSPVPGSPAPTSDGGGPIAITRDSKVLYTTTFDGLLAFQINADGSLTNASVPSYSMSDAQVGLVSHPTADFLYASGNSGVLTVFAIDSATGALNPTSSVTLGNEFLENSAVITPNGRYLYQNDLDRNDGLFPTSLQLAAFSTDAATGALSPVPGTPLTVTTPSPSTTSSSGPMVIDPTGKFLYVGYQFVVVNVGSAGGLAAYSIDAASGALTAVPGSPFDVGGVPSSVAIDASGGFLIVSIFPLGGGSRLAVFSIDPDTGALTSVPGSFGSTYVWGAVAADASGPYVYAGTSLETANSPAIAFVLSIDQATGALASIGETTIPDKLGVSFLALTH